MVASREIDGLRGGALSAEDTPRRRPVGFTDEAVASRGSQGAWLISCPGSELLSWAETLPLSHQPFAAPGSTGNGVWLAPGGPAGSRLLTAPCAHAHTHRDTYTHGYSGACWMSLLVNTVSHDLVDTCLLPVCCFLPSVSHSF